MKNTDTVDQDNPKNLGIKRGRDNTENNNKVDNSSITYYKNLPQSNRIYLCKLVSIIDRKSNMLSKSLSDTQKTRHNSTDKLLSALLYGIEELKIKSKDFWDKHSKDKPNTNILLSNSTLLSKDNINDETFTQTYCKNLSIEIEYLIYLKNDETTNSIYNKKLLTLYKELIDERNTELRIAVLLNDIPPIKLVGMSSEELAPSIVKKKRLEQQNKYFKEQVLMVEEQKIIAKNQKGGLLSVDPKDKNSEGGGYMNFDYIVSHTNIKPKETKSSSTLLKGDKNRDDDKMKEGALSSVGGNSGQGMIKRMNENNRKMRNINVNDSSRKEMELKFKNLSSEKLNFYFDLDEHKKESIFNRFNEKIKSGTNASTIDEINKIRELLKHK